jgi:transcriptional regulator with XRE-family HTH domain
MVEPAMQELFQAIRDRRTELDMSRKELGLRVGCSASGIEQLENGRTKDITVIQLIKVCKALGYDFFKRYCYEAHVYTVAELSDTSLLVDDENCANDSICNYVKEQIGYRKVQKTKFAKVLHCNRATASRLLHSANPYMTVAHAALLSLRMNEDLIQRFFYKTVN